MIAAVAVATVVALGLRVGLIEPEAFGHLCAGGGAPWWCGPRGLLIGTLHAGVLGAGAVVFGVLGAFRRRSAFAVAAAALGASGLLLYDVEIGAVGLLLGALVLVRPPAGEPRTEHRPAEK